MTLRAKKEIVMSIEQTIIELSKIIVPPLAVIISSFVTFKVTQEHNTKKENRALKLMKIEALYEKILKLHAEILELSENFTHNELDKVTREKVIDIQKGFQNIRVYEKLYTGNIGLSLLEAKANSHLQFMLYSIKKKCSRKCFK